jgi:hypothetical protein
MGNGLMTHFVQEGPVANCKRDQTTRKGPVPIIQRLNAMRPRHIAPPKLRPELQNTDARFGSKADIEARQSNVRFTPESEHPRQ